ncbi:MAG: DUF3999 family protein [Pirellulales bacterium]
MTRTTIPLPAGLLSRWLLALAIAAPAWSGAAAQEGDPAEDRPAVVSGDQAEPLSAWQYVQKVSPVPKAAADKASPWCDFAVPVSVFDGARTDLADLRLFDRADKEVPYALRIRRVQHTSETVPAKQASEGTTPEGAVEKTFDLGSNAIEHNEMAVDTAGSNFRRRAQLDGSDNGQDWRRMLETDVVRFTSSGQSIDGQKLSYAPSRFRYLRVRVFPDPIVDGSKPVEVRGVTVRRGIELPGEYVTLPGALGPREAVRADGGPGSAWVVDLGAKKLPCERLTVEIADPEFSRDFRIDVAGPAGSNEPFRWLTRGSWARRAGDVRGPMTIDFGEVAAARLKLVMTDNRNPPLRVEKAKFTAPIRQVVFARAAAENGPLRLYYGNPEAQPPRYDLERNLPLQLDPAPLRLTLGPREENPAYVPAPQPLTERWPWLIYVVLSSVSFLLGVVIVSLARKAVALHDGQSGERPA